MSKPVGWAILTLSTLGYPMTEFVARRGGRAGALLIQGVTAGLLVRDAAMIRAGAPRRLRQVPAILLWCEAVAAAVAALTSLPLVLNAQAREEVTSDRPGPFEALRRAALGTLFGLHTVRFRIYLQPDAGLRRAEPPR